METVISNKIRIIPNKEHEQQLWKTFKITRFIYNCTFAKNHANSRLHKLYNLYNSNLIKEVIIHKNNKLPRFKEASFSVIKQILKMHIIDIINFKGLAKNIKFESRRKTKPLFYNDTSKLKIKL